VPEYSLAAWHGLTLPLVMSLLALGGGAAYYRLLLARRGGAAGPAPLIHRFDGKRAFDVVNIWVVKGADRLGRAISSRRLQPQLFLIVCAVLVATYLGLRDDWNLGEAGPTQPLDPAFALLWTIGAACAIGAAWQGKFHRLAALIMVGGAGLVTCVTFAWFSAPDLALTQVSVEVVTTILLLLGLRWMPKRIQRDDAPRRTRIARLRRARDLVVAVIAGGGMAGIVYAILTRPAGGGIGTYFLERALPDGGGRNVVNVILVDFRSFDTLGEITVLCVVALAVYKLLRRFRPAPESVRLPRIQLDDLEHEASPDPDRPLPPGSMMVPAVLGGLLLPVAGLVSVFFLLRGHNAPGGGFVGGLVMATAFIVQYLLNGTIWVESRLRIHPQLWIAAGLLAAAGAGAGAWLASQAFLTSLEWHGRLPLVGEVHLSSTLLFDFGVYALVIGTTTLMLVAIAHQSLRSHRISEAAGSQTETRVVA
jgi:multicomponent K+:H+ antiporter subunit A